MDFRFWEEQDENRDTPPGRMEIGERFAARTEKYKYRVIQITYKIQETAYIHCIRHYRPKVNFLNNFMCNVNNFFLNL